MAKTVLHGLLLLMLVAQASFAFDQLADARQALRSNNDRQRQEALRTLAELGSEEAWELVLDTLADPEPRIADEAQLVLEEVTAEFDELLFGKSGLGQKRGLVALRVAEALGRRSVPLDQTLWLKALRHKDAEVRRSLLWSLERLGEDASGEHDKLAGALEKLAARDKDELARAHAWLALAALDPEIAGRSLEARLRDKSPAARAACAMRIELAADDGQLRMLRTLAGDETHIVRLRTFEAFARRNDREGPRGLASALEQEQGQRLSWRIVELLQDLSGRKDGRNARAWQHWADSLPADWTPANKTPERDYGERTVAFVGMPVLSDRIAFLVDFSGSMWEERADGRTRKQAVDVEMRRVLEHLPEGARFNLIPFVSTPTLWQKSLTQATPKSIKKALTFFEKHKAQGKGNYWDAMLTALADPQTDTIMILGDGAPSGGTRWNLKLMGPLFTHANRFRGVFVDAILIDTKGRLRGYWEELTAASGGRLIVVNL